MTISHTQTTTMNRPWTDRQTMKRLCDRGLSQEEMAEELGCSQTTISKWLNEHELEHDLRPERSGGHRVGVGIELHRPGPYSGLYPRWKAWDSEEGNKYVYIHRLLAVSEYGLDAVKDNHVHHRNEIPWDNRPDNIVPVSPEEHKRRFHQ